jgi:hypothetical protein
MLSLCEPACGAAERDDGALPGGPLPTGPAPGLETAPGRARPGAERLQERRGAVEPTPLPGGGLPERPPRDAAGCDGQPERGPGLCALARHGAGRPAHRVPPHGPVDRPPAAGGASRAASSPARRTARRGRSPFATAPGEPPKHTHPMCPLSIAPKVLSGQVCGALTGRWQACYGGAAGKRHREG